MWQVMTSDDMSCQVKRILVIVSKIRSTFGVTQCSKGRDGTVRYKKCFVNTVPMVVGQYCVFRLNVTLVMYGYGTVPMQWYVGVSMPWGSFCIDTVIHNEYWRMASKVHSVFSVTQGCMYRIGPAQEKSYWCGADCDGTVLCTPVGCDTAHVWKQWYTAVFMLPYSIVRRHLM